MNELTAHGSPTSAARDPGLWARVSDSFKRTGRVLKDAGLAFYERDPFQNSAIVAFYTILSLPGLLTIAIAVAGYFFGAEAVTARLSKEITNMIGPEAAKQIESIVANSMHADGFTFTSIIGIATLVFGATGVFYNLQQILNRIWHVKAKPKKAFLLVLRARLFSFGLVLAVGFLLLVSLMLSAILSVLSDWIRRYVSAGMLAAFHVIDIGVSVLLSTLLFAAIYKVLPDVKIRWRTVWVGAVFTAVLFEAAKWLMGIWLGASSPATAYGASGTIIMIMLWVFYAALILLFGAEFTYAFGRRYGHPVIPAKGAEVVDAGQAEKPADDRPDRLVAEPEK